MMMDMATGTKDKDESIRESRRKGCAVRQLGCDSFVDWISEAQSDISTTPMRSIANQRTAAQAPV
jgi:hypothetical protein